MLEALLHIRPVESNLSIGNISSGAQEQADAEQDQARSASWQVECDKESVDW